MTAQDFVYAGVGKRAVAYFIDAIILAVIGVFLTLPGAMLSDTVALFGNIALPVAVLGYSIFFEGRSGQTPGKRVMGITVISADGQPCSYAAAAIRNVLRVVDALFMYLVGIAAIVVTSNNQRIGDLAAGTIVIQGSNTQPQQTQ